MGRFCNTTDVFTNNDKSEMNSLVPVASLFAPTRLVNVNVFAL